MPLRLVFLPCLFAVVLSGLAAATPPGEASWHVLVQDPAGEWRMAGRWPARADSPPLKLVGGLDSGGPVRELIGLPPGVPPPSR